MGEIKLGFREANGIEVKECIGLRSDGAGGLQATGDLDSGVAHAGKLLGEIEGRVYSCIGRMLYVGEQSVECDTPVNSVCAVGNGRVLVMCEGSSPAYLDVKQMVIERQPRLSLPYFSIRSQAQQSQALPARKLSGSYRGGDTALTLADASTLRSDYFAAYRRLVAGASAGGGYFAPILARVVLYGHNGERLLEGPPVLLTPPQDGVFGGQAAEYTLTPDGGISGGTLRGLSYRPVVNRPEEAGSEWEHWVARVSVEVSPQLHGVDSTGWCGVRIAAESGTQNMSLRVTAPGMPLTEASGGSEWWRRQVELMLGRFEQEAYEVGSWDAKQFESETVSHNRPADGLDEQRSVSSRICQELPSASVAEQALRSPHQFSARLATVNGTTIAYGGVSALPFEGYTARDYSVGEGKVSALLAYPDGRCRRLLADGAERALKPTADGRWGFALGSNLRGESASTITTDLTGLTQTQPGPGLVGTASLTDPLRLRAMAELPGEAVALTPSVRSKSSWDFGRVHYYAFTPVGIHALALASSGESLQATEIDARGVANGDLVSVGERGVIAYSGDRLLRVAGSSVETLAEVAGVERLGCDPEHGEIWVGGSWGTRIYGSDLPRWRSAGMNVDAFGGVGTRGLLVSAGGKAYHAMRGSGSVYAKWRGWISIPAGKRVDGLELRMSGGSFDGWVTLRSISGATISRYRLSGEAHGLSVRVAAPIRRRIEVLIEGTAMGFLVFSL